MNGQNLFDQCLLSDGTHECSTKISDASCNISNCCDYAGNISPAPSTSLNISKTFSTTSTYVWVENVATDYFNYPSTHFMQQCWGMNTYSLIAGDSNADFSTRVQLVSASVYDSSLGGTRNDKFIRVDFDPNDPVWSYTSVQLKINFVHPTDSTKNFEYLSNPFLVEVTCPAVGILSLVSFSPTSFFQYITSSPIIFTFEPGNIVCMDHITFGPLTYSVEMESGSDSFDQSSFTQSGSSYSIQLIDSYVQDYFVYFRVKATDEVNTVYSATDCWRMQCDNSSTSLTFPPDSVTDSVNGFEYTQSGSLLPSTSGETLYFVYKDWINSLVELQPTTDCVTELRVESTSNSDPDDSSQPRLTGIFSSTHQVQGDGTVKMEFIGDKTVAQTLQFYLIGKPLDGQGVASPLMTFMIECTEESNTVSHPGGIPVILKEGITGSYSFYISRFQETWSAGCPVDSYQIKDDIIAWRKDQFGEILLQFDGMTDLVYELEDYGTDQIKLSQKLYCVNEMHYEFQVQALMGSLVVAETEIITVHATLNVTKPYVLEENLYSNITGPFVHTVSQFIDTNSYCDMSLMFTVNSVHTLSFSGDFQESIEDELQFPTMTSDSASINIQYPNHCYHQVEYSMILSLEYTANPEYLRHTTNEFKVTSTNSIDLIREQELPNVVEFEAGQVSQWTLDLHDYFHSTNPGCLLEKFMISSIVESDETGAQISLSEAEIEALIGIDESGTLRIKDLDSKRQGALIYVQANNSAVQSQIEEPLISLTITLPVLEAYTVTIPPQFESELPELDFVGVSLDKIFNYSLPGIIDEQPSTVALSFESGWNDAIMSFGEDNTISFQGAEGEHILGIKLLDEDGESSLYKLKVTFEYEIAEEEEEAEKDSSIESQPIIQSIKDQASVFEFTGWTPPEEGQEQEQQLEQDIEERTPIDISLNDFSSNGELKLSFSELLEPLEFYKEQGLNLTVLNENIKSFVDIRYICFGSVDEDEEGDQVSTIPQLKSWKVQEFSESSLSMKLNFTNPLYVSSYGLKDKLTIKFVGSYLFVAKSDKEQLEANYTLERLDVPPQVASQEQFETIQLLGQGASSSMLVTLIIPFCFMVFMSASMNRVWAMYNMMQIVSNFENYLTLSIPANAFFIIQVIKSISFFSLLTEANVQAWMEDKVFRKMQGLQSILVGQGTLVSGIIFFALTIGTIKFALKFKFARDSLLRLKDKLMWSSFLRAQIQTYFPTVLATLQMMRGMYSYVVDSDLPQSRRILQSESLLVAFEKNFENTFMALFKLFLLVSLPIFSLYFIRKNKARLDEDQFQRKYGTLYQNLGLKSNSVFLFNTLFCFRRFCVGASTVFESSLLIMNIYVMIFGSLLVIKFLFHYKPFNSRLLNTFEILNEIFVLFISYFMFLFTDFVPDVEYRFELGYRFIAFTGLIFFVNVMLISVDIFKSTLVQRKRQSYKKEWEKFERLKDKMINFLIWESIQSNPDLPKSLEDIKMHREVIRAELTFGQMAEKIQQIFKNRESVSEDLESEQIFTLGARVNTLKIKQSELELQDSPININDLSKSEIKVETPRFNQIESYPMDRWRVEDSISDDSVDSHVSRVSMDQQGCQRALQIHKEQLDKKLWKIQGDPQFAQKKEKIMQRYDEIRQKIVKDQYDIEDYLEQENFYGTQQEKQEYYGQNLISREELNEEFLIKKRICFY